MKILVVEDQPKMGEYLKQGLTEAGFVADLARTGTDGLHYAMSEEYDLFILEVVKAWTDPDREERRTIHHNGDGTFVVDGRTIDLKKKMVKWKEYL